MLNDQIRSKVGLIEVSTSTTDCSQQIQWFMVLATLPIHRPKVPTLQSITKPIIGEIKAPHTDKIKLAYPSHWRTKLIIHHIGKINNTPHWLTHCTFGKLTKRKFTQVKCSYPSGYTWHQSLQSPTNCFTLFFSRLQFIPTLNKAQLVALLLTTNLKKT